MQEEWETARRCLEICSKADERVVKEHINIFENFKGDEEVLQFFVSTTGTIVLAKDISVGPRGVQFGAQISDASLQQVVRDFARNNQFSTVNATPETTTATVDNVSFSNFRDRYGPGFKVNEQSAQEEGRLSSTERPGSGNESSSPSNF